MARAISASSSWTVMTLCSRGDVLEHPHASSKLVGVRRKHAYTANIRHFVKTSVCADASMLITGAILLGGATICAASADDCRLDAMLAHDLETLRVRPRRKSSAIVVSS